MSKLNHTSLSTTSNISVKITGGPHIGETFAISKESFSIGRGPDNDIILINDPKLSRNHLKLTLHQSKMKISNLSARNLILFNNNFEKEVSIQRDEKIRIGDTELHFTWTTDQTEVHVEQFNYDEKTSIVNASTSIKTSQPQPSSLSPANKSETPLANHPEVVYPKGNYEVNNNNLHKSHPYQRSKSSKHLYKEKNLMLLIGGVGILLLIIVLSSGGEKKAKKSNILKDTTQLSSELMQKSEDARLHAKEKHLGEDGRIDRLYESAQSFYIKGFRDYRNGQFIRAITSFQAALSFDPNHILARKYLHQSIKKQDELMQFNLDQAKRYRDKNNFRLCRASAQNVMVMSPQKGSAESRYLGAKKLFDECDTLSKGRY